MKWLSANNAVTGKTFIAITLATFGRVVAIYAECVALYARVGQHIHRHNRSVIALVYNVIVRGSVNHLESLHILLTVQRHNVLAKLCEGGVADIAWVGSSRANRRSNH